MQRPVLHPLLLLGWATAACAIASLAGCGDGSDSSGGSLHTTPPGTTRSTSTSADLLRLDEDLLPLRKALDPAAPPAPQTRVSWPDPDLSAGLSWWAVKGPTLGPFRFAAIPSTAALPLEAAETPQDNGLLTTLGLLDVTVGEVLQLTFTFTGATRPLPTDMRPVDLVQLTWAVDTGAVAKGGKARRLLGELADRSAHVPLAEQQGSTARFTTWLTVRPSTRQLALVMPPLPDGLRLQELLIERRSLVELQAAANREPVAEFDATEGHAPGASSSLAPRAHEMSAADEHGRVAVSLDREQRRSLRLPADTELTWTLPTHDRPYRFEASLGLLPRDPALGGAMQLSLSADGTTLADFSATGSGSADIPAWQPLSFDVPQGTEQLTLRATWPTGDGPLAVLAHPRLRRATQKPRLNLLMVSLDTLRPDHLGCYGGAAPSAHIDAFAETALRFETAYSTSSYTLPSHASLLSGQLPLMHGARATRDHLDPERTPLMTSVLADAGWVTAAFTGGGFLSTTYGFGTGFDRFSHNDPCWPVDTLRGRMLLGPDPSSHDDRLQQLSRFDVDHISDWFAEQPQGAPFFALVHTYAAHNYAPDRRWLERAGLTDDDGQELLLDRTDYHAWKAGAHELRQAVTDEFTRFYDASVGSADDFIGSLLAGLEQAGLASNTIVVILSDHGEELGEVDVFGHGKSLNEGVTRVPLLVRIPGRAAQVVHPAISLADLAPWLLELLDVPVDPAMRPAPALAPNNNDPPGRSITLLDLSTGDDEQWAVRMGNFKLQQGADGEESRLYDLSSKAGESVDVAAQHPAERARLEHALQQYRALQPEPTSTMPNALDSETRRTLEQLGYLQGDG